MAVASPTPPMGALVERFSGLERQVEAETKARKDNEDMTLHSISETLSRLQMTMQAEIQRREEGNANIQVLFDSKVSSMQDKLEEIFLERFDQVHSTIDSLSDRMAAIEKGFSSSRGRYVKEAEDRAVRVARDVQTLRTAMKEEFESRREREGHAAARLREVEAATAEKFMRGQQICDQKFEHLLQSLQESRICREAGDRRFQARVIEEVSSLKDSLVCETQAREQSDDDIVNALNHYTKELQKALRVINQA